MSKLRVYELAKEFNISSKELLDKIKNLNIKAASHMSNLEEEQVLLIKEKFSQDKKKGVIEKKAAPSPKPLTKNEPLVKLEDKKIKEKGQKLEEQKIISKPIPISKIELKKVLIPEIISVGDLANLLKVNVNEIIKFLMKQGLMLTINQNLDFSLAEKTAKNFGYTAAISIPLEKKILEVKRQGTLQIRPPVVTVLGHVDHGKTSLLDAIRKSNLVSGEAGGITQKIGAYNVEYEGKKIIFIDTPGHEAFTSMRARGAKVTDLVILVVAADDGVMPQTIEAINHAKAAKTPIIVAINKIDKPQANPERVKQQLADLGILPEDWGGDVVCIPVSAKQKVGISELLEMIILVAEMQELKADYNGNALGTIIEAKLDKGLGPVATVLVQNGTLKIQDAVVAGTTYGKIRAMLNDQGGRINKATPSTPVEMIGGLNDVPHAGDILQVVDDKSVRQIMEERVLKNKEEKLNHQRTSLDNLFKQIKEGDFKELNIIIKADNQGGAEALKYALSKLQHENVRLNCIHAGVGAINESDILLASASNAIIIGFNVRADLNIKKLAEQEKVDIRFYGVIYNIIEDIKAAMAGLLKPEYREVLIGKAEVRNIFKVSKVGIIAGSYVLEGKVQRGLDARVIRDSAVIFECKISSLKRFKEDVKEVQAGYECGIGIEKFGGLQSKDIIEIFALQKVSEKVLNL
ncbi:MAG: translation initiation factor IF-2 [Armatimonadetes bacterium]|nr:translation initiation factor IF-2 [Armatimonadota bacterium]